MKNWEEIYEEYYTHITDDFAKEQWADIDGAPMYQVSDYGRVRRIPGKGSPMGKIQSPQKHKLGYLLVVVRDIDKKPMSRTIHSLVAESFNIEKPLGKNIHLNFINENKLDCRVSNLRYVPHQEAITSGTVQERRVKHIYKKVNQIDVETGEIIKTWDSPVMAQREGGFSKDGISQCCRGKSKTHKEYKWEYVEEK